MLKLFCLLAYKEGNFILSSGQESSYYINAKPVILNPFGALATGRLLFSLLPETAQGVAGLTLGADSIVTEVSIVSACENRPIPDLIMRKEAKGHGTMAYIEGPDLELGAEVIVLEDGVTTGASALKAVRRLRDAGYKVNQIISLVDRKQNGADLYKEQGINFKFIFSIQEIQAGYKFHQST